MNRRIDFLYLSEPDTIRAGVNDIPRCIDVCEEVLALLARGDYRMGGPTHNSHGMSVTFPVTSPFPAMPLAGPDRRFTAMPAYLGGRFDVAGLKWYGSNAANKAKGQPRSILTVMLNDKETGQPLCLMSANLLSAARTAAVPAVAVRHVAPRDAKTVAVIGCGPVNRTCLDYLLHELPDVERVICHNRSRGPAENVRDHVTDRHAIAAEIADGLEEAVRDADIVTVAVSRTHPLLLRKGAFKSGAVVLINGVSHGDERFYTEANLIYDHLGLHEAHMSEAAQAADKEAFYDDAMAGPIYRLIEEGKLPPLSAATSLAQIVAGERPVPRERDLTVVIAGGMAVYDVAWGHEIYQNALREGIGQKLLLWEDPAL